MDVLFFLRFVRWLWNRWGIVFSADFPPLTQLRDEMCPGLVDTTHISFFFFFSPGFSIKRGDGKREIFI